MEKAQVLIVEDDGIIAMDIESQLKQLGYGVTAIVGYGEEAVEKAKENTPDVVLMDIVLKGEIDGITAAEEIRTQSDIPVIFLTAFADKKRLQKAKLTYPFGFIIKPFQNKDLEVTIEMALYVAKVDSERKQAEEDLHKSEEKFRSLFNNAEVGMFRTRIDGSEILDMNEKFLEIFCRTKEEMQGSPSVIHWADPSEREEMVHRLELEGRVTNFECGMLNKHGAVRTCLTSLRLYRDQGILEGSVIDITDRKRAEEALRESEEQLQQAQKMEAIGTLAGGIAHDFNNILFPMMGFAEMVLDDLPEDSPFRNNIKEILQGVKRASDLVKQILAFSRQSHKESRPLKVQLIVKEVLKLMRSSLPSTIEIKQHISNKCDLVMADATQIHQVAMNLMTNAFQAMEDEGGELEVTLKEVELGAEGLTDPSMTPGAYVCLTVADTGPGMDQSVISRIFEPYFTTKENGKGTGLGLAVVHGIVKNFNGDIKVFSEPGMGTAFHVYLPVIKSQVETEETEAVTPVQKGTERILLVDDEEPIVSMETQMLERLGYDVTERTSSIEALEAFRASPDKFDLVITDMTMPNMTGVQLSQKLLEIRPDIPIIICTGFSTKIDGEKAKAAGIRGYVMKPVVMSEIAKKIREVLKKD